MVENQQTTADMQKMKDDDREALLPGAFPQTEDGEHTEQDNDGTDVMDILKAAGADIVDDASQKEERKRVFLQIVRSFTEEDEEDEEENQLQLSEENKQILDEMGKDQKKKGKREKALKRKSRESKETEEREKRKEKKKIPEVPEKNFLSKGDSDCRGMYFTGGGDIALSSFLTEYDKTQRQKSILCRRLSDLLPELFREKNLDETEQVMYSKSESILTIRMWLREYEVFVNEGSELEALDSLLQAVHDYRHC